MPEFSQKSNFDVFCLCRKRWPVTGAALWLVALGLFAVYGAIDPQHLCQAKDRGDQEGDGNRAVAPPDPAQK